MLNQYGDLLTKDEACEVLKIGKNALNSLLRSGRLKACRDGRVLRIPKDSLIEFMYGKSDLNEIIRPWI